MVRSTLLEFIFYENLRFHFYSFLIHLSQGHWSSSQNALNIPNVNMVEIERISIDIDDW